MADTNHMDRNLALEAVRDAGEAAATPVTFFEATYLAAVHVFAKAGVDFVVLEVGLGGRLDATNTCHPVASIITALSMEHCETLGETLDEAVAAGIEWIHLDVMDGNWVVNKTITFGPAVVRSIRDRLGDDVFIDCHLMVTNAEENWDQYVAAGVDLVILTANPWPAWRTACQVVRPNLILTTK